MMFGHGAQVPGTRSHLFFARSEVRISVMDDGQQRDSQWPTGFSADVEGNDPFHGFLFLYLP